MEQFSDVPKNAWYYDSVDYVLENGLMVGMNDSSFAPEAEITRAMFVTVLYRMSGAPQLSEEALDAPFGDVKGSSWYADAVYWARENGIVQGNTPEEFSPNQGITREQAYDLALNFGGGMGCGATCGALVGALAALGGLGLPQEKRLELIERFRAENGAIDCATLLEAAYGRGEEKKPHCDGVVYRCVDYVCQETGLE